jgi:hypothetical protein
LAFFEGFDLLEGDRLANERLEGGLVNFFSFVNVDRAAYGSASLMSLRILLRVSPRQSPSSAILFEMSSDADWPWLATDFFMFSS